MNSAENPIHIYPLSFSGENKMGPIAHEALLSRIESLRIMFVPLPPTQ